MDLGFFFFFFKKHKHVRVYVKTIALRDLVSPSKPFKYRGRVQWFARLSLFPANKSTQYRGKVLKKWIEMIPRHLPVFWSPSDTHAHILLLNYLIDTLFSVRFSSVPSLNRARLFGIPWAAARQASLPIFLPFHTVHGVLKARSGLPFPSPVDSILSDLSTVTYPSWVAPHDVA